MPESAALVTKRRSPHDSLSRPVVLLVLVPYVSLEVLVVPEVSLRVPEVSLRAPEVEDLPVVLPVS
jgi:hypothetical protein